MTTEERRYRFSEIMTAVHLTPTMGEATSGEEFLLPNGTLGLSDGRLRSAIMCQVFKEDEEFSARLVNALANTAMENISKNDNPSEDDMYALSIAIHTCWGVGAFNPLLALLGTTGKIAENFEVDIPEDISLVFRPNAHAKMFGKFNPLDMCDEDMDVEKFQAVIEEVLGKDNDDDK
jgi:hypothetical protein